jgi:hypothetical protein
VKKSNTFIAALLTLSLPVIAQTTVAPTVNNGVATYTYTDVNGNIVTLAVPVPTAQNATVTYTPAPPPPAAPTITAVQVACAPTSLAPSATSLCNATVQGTGSYDPTVTLSATAGSVDPSGLFTAANSAGTATVTATSTQDATKSGTATITVQTASNGAPAIPANAIAVDLINPKNAWKNTKDAGTPGSATFSNNYPVSGIFANDARAFSIAYQNAGGVRFSNSFAKDTVSTHFVYDVVVRSPDWTHTANLELDLNQVKADGRTAILGMQCSNYSKTWEVTLNKTGNTGWHWVPSNIPCTPLKWTPNVSHHIRLFGTLASNGIATYVGVEFDGSYSAFTNASGLTARAIGWGIGSVLPNFQIDGLGASGSATIYSNKLTIIRW